MDINLKYLAAEIPGAVVFDVDRENLCTTLEMLGEPEDPDTPPLHVFVPLSNDSDWRAFASPVHDENTNLSARYAVVPLTVRGRDNTGAKVVEFHADQRNEDMVHELKHCVDLLDTSLLAAHESYRRRQLTRTKALVGGILLTASAEAGAIEVIAHNTVQRVVLPTALSVVLYALWRMRHRLFISGEYISMSRYRNGPLERRANDTVSELQVEGLIPPILRIVQTEGADRN